MDRDEVFCSRSGKRSFPCGEKEKVLGQFADELTKHGIYTTPQNVWKFIKRCDID